MTESLQGRLFAAVFAAIVLSVGITVSIGAYLAHRATAQSTATSLAKRADLLAVQEQKQPSYIAEDYTSDSNRVVVDRVSAMAKFLPAGRSVTTASDGRVRLGGTTYLYSYRPMGARGLELMRAANLGSSIWGSLLRDLALAGLVGAVLATGLSFVLARSISRPVARVAEASRALAAGAEPQPLPEHGAAEIAALAQAFNEMADELHTSRESERAFLLSVSHELKTPLTAIRGYAEGLAEGVFAPEDAARTIGVEARRLERLVYDILDLARMRRASFSVRREAVDLTQVAREAVARHATTARTFGVALSVVGDTEAWVEADLDRVLQVASNLVENALRETPEGGSVTVEAAPGHLLVSDTGPGLTSDDLERAFERFYLYDKHGKERPVGSGLGLAIVKQLTTAMGGDVTVESAPGTGARFVVALPDALVPEAVSV
jgi:two-component system sensor histidine kinase BaeS